MRIKRFSKSNDDIPAKEYIGYREEWDYDRLRNKPTKYLKNASRERTPEEEKNFRKNRALLYGGSIGAGAMVGGASHLNSSVPRGVLIGAAGGLGVAGTIDALSRIHHAKRARIAKEELERRKREGKN